jgi:hypothetical protein
MTSVGFAPEPVTIDVFDRYQPMPKQAAFHKTNAKYRFFGGGFGNGKTSAGCAEALALALEYPGCTGLIARKTRPELEATTMHTFFNGGGGDPDGGDFVGCPEELIRRHNKSKHKIELINGSIIYYWPLDEPEKLTNLNLGWFMIDQAEEVPEEMFMMLIGRLRQVKAPRKGLLLFNPNGHDWIWRRCVHMADVYTDHALIHAKTSDNFNLPSDYIEQFRNYPESWKKRFFDGSFDVFTDQIWPEYDPDVHEIRPVPLEPWWEICEGIDHGRRNPTAVLWCAFFAAHGHEYCFVFDEHYVAGKVVSYHAKAIQAKRREYLFQPMWTVIDASAAQKDPNTERSVIDEYWDHGIHTIPSDRHKLARIIRVAEWLSLDEDVPHPLTGERRAEGWPRIYFFKTLVEITEHIPQYKWKPQPPTRDDNAPEEALKKDDHDVDALGYILMMRPQPGVAPVGSDPNHDARSGKYWDRYRSMSQNHGRSRTGVD